ncbi:GntR family transcriptional regulator [Brevundimonas bullata]
MAKTGEREVRLHDPYHRALSALSGFAGEGRFGAGTPLVVTTLARDLGLSPTPVREALARLAGEGVIDHWPGRGYFAPGLATADIVELYDYHQRLVLWAVEAPVAGEVPIMDHAGASVVDRLERVFAGAAERSGNRVLMRAQRQAAARLRPVRLAEAAVAPLAADELECLERLLGDEEGSRFREAVIRYHEGRLKLVSSIASAIRRSGESIVQI